MRPIDFKLVYEHTHTLNLLYVEDDDMLREVTENLFKNFFNTVDTARNGQEGLDQYNRFHEERGEYYDLVITDIKMPVMDGIKLTSSIRHINNEQIIIVISAYNDSENLLSLIELGVDNFILKPMDNQQMMNVLFKFGQRVQDRKLVNEYIQKLEVVNSELAEANTTIEADRKQLQQQLRALQQKSNTIDTKHQQISMLMQNPKIVSTIPPVEQPLKSNEPHEAFYLLEDHCDDLLEIINDIPELIFGYKTYPDVVSKMVKHLSRISSILYYYSPFLDQLSISFNELSETILHHGERFMQLLESDNTRLLILFDAVTHDLEDYINRFRTESLVMENIHKIHLPTALSIQQIVQVISPEEVETGDMEFF